MSSRSGLYTKHKKCIGMGLYFSDMLKIDEIKRACLIVKFCLESEKVLFEMKLDSSK